MERKVVFVLSTNFAGAHYASLLLGSHSKAAHLGETKRIRKTPGTKPICNACGDADHCPAYHGCDEANIDQMFGRVFANLGTTIEALVDCSKQPRWAERFVGRSPVALKFVHLVRDPRALVRRWAVHNQRTRRRLRKRLTLMRKAPSLALPVLVAPQNRMWMYKWLAQNRAITSFLARHRLDHQIVTYHDLARHPERELQRLMGWLELKYEPEQVDYWDFEHHGSQKIEYEWVKKEQARFLDARWKRFLDPVESRAIATHPRVVEYLRELRIEAGEDGLLRIG